ncbi:Uracil phosphoribosyltransferase [Granulibacter bethesdensis]|uniref:Uracil phosphoribosyltransferase n=2 Tax=Granulibacter bethesdensis TaxID=364410 RepID=Q0BPI8_GRABC|nr:Uracil phosphoribosyltransferase [Granulibacter bethesdensis CGDNIH1]AHJ69572.1 Uracil phosphoribosyltransferase [Granulibacter bethesdensis]APH53146.1 Uracil phosphoribosyltransferase [Granulibacter bethesdensis]APH65835.1 Uracil phosphoribosyltransferase [Granulibacter bethesdensis]
MPGMAGPSFAIVTLFASCLAPGHTDMRRCGESSGTGCMDRTDETFPTLTVLRHPLLQHKLTLLRRHDTSTGEFRRLVREMSLLMGYEVTRALPVEDIEIETPLEKMRSPVLTGKKLCLVSILRAGSGLLDGLLELIPAARVGHVGLYRDEATLIPVEYYLKLPADIAERLVVVVDPMLATGGSAVTAITRLKQAGAVQIIFLCLLAVPEGVRHLASAHPDIEIVTVGLDRELDAHGYIRPGLGDAGDRLFGTK